MEEDIFSIDCDVKEPGSAVIQFAVVLQNRVGSLHSLVRLLSSKTVHVIGFSVQDSRDVTIARLVVSDPEIAENLFIDRGIPYSCREVVVVAVRESAAGLQECLEVLLAAETNVDFAYPLMIHPEGKTLIAMHLEDCEFGKSVLRSSGLMVMFQDDLSR